MATKGLGFRSQVKVYKQPNAVTTAITSITNANPAVATITGHALTSGDVVYVESVSNEAVNGYYFAKVTDADTVSLIGLDGTAIGTVTDAKFVKVESYTFCDSNSIKIEAMKTKSTDATTNCDEAPVTELEKDAGSISIGALWSPDKEVHDYLDDCFEELQGLFVAIKPYASKKLFGFAVGITSYSNDGQSNEKWKSSLEFVVNGRKRKMVLGA